MRPLARRAAIAEIGPPSVSPPPTAADPLTNVLRVKSMVMLWHPPESLANKPDGYVFPGDHL
jgi:hypothetical protein